MNVRIILKADFDEYFYEIKGFCRLAIQDCDNTITRHNMDYVFWKSDPASLMFKLYVKKSFEMLTLVYDEKNSLIGLAGVEPYNKDVALIGRRLFILSGYRKQQICHRYIIIPQIEYIKQKGYKLGIGTVNEYKKVIYNIIKRKIDQKSKYVYSNFELMKEPIFLNNTEQWVFGIYMDEKYKERTIKEWLCY